MQLVQALRASVRGVEASLAVPLLVSCALLAALFTWRTLVRIRSNAPKCTDSDTDVLPGAVVEEKNQSPQDVGQDALNGKDATAHIQKHKRHAQTEHLEETHHTHHHHHHHTHTHHRDSSSASSSSSDSRSHGEAKRPHRAKTDLRDHHSHTHHDHEDHNQRHRGHTQYGSVDHSHRSHQSRILPLDGEFDVFFLRLAILKRADSFFLSYA